MAVQQMSKEERSHPEPKYPSRRRHSQDNNKEWLTAQLQV